jgi:DNA-binding response OmpR family regulator
MAKVVLIGLEQEAAGQICRALALLDSHQIEQQSQNVVMRDLLDADIVFAGGEPACYTSLLRRVREARPTLPFVIVTRIPETKEWLDALEAGATDYCSVPIETRQLHWLMKSALPRPRSASA